MTGSMLKKDEMLSSLYRLIYSGIIIFLLYVTGRGYLNWLENSPLFDIKSIKIEGSNYLSEKEVLRLSNLDIVKRVWDADLESAVESIKTYPFIENAEIVRRFPNRLEIKIKEKEPVALINFQGDLYSVDKQGLVLPTIPGRMYNLPVISGKFKGGIKIGSRISGSIADKGLFVIRTIITEHPYLYNDISEVFVNNDGNITIYTHNKGIPVKMGNKDILNRINYLWAILQEIKREKTVSEIKYIDLRFRGQVIVGMRT